MATPEEQPITEQEEAEAPAATPLAAAEPEALDLIELFNTTVSEYDATFVVYYRGLWWPYCKVRETRTMAIIYGTMRRRTYSVEFVHAK